MRTPSRKYEDLTARALSGLAALALCVITFGMFVAVPAWLESSGVDVQMPHIDEAAPKMSAAPQYSD